MAAPTARLSVVHTLPRFLLVGASGVVVNQVMLGVLHIGLRLPLLIASALATETAIANNYWWNERWTFKCGVPSLGRFLHFNGIALVGLAMTVATLGLLVNETDLAPLVANLFAIGVGTIGNFTASHLWVWRSAHE